MTKLKIWGWGDYPALSEWMVNVISGAYERGKGGCDYTKERRGPQEGRALSREDATLALNRSRHEAGHARKAAPGSGKGRKMDFPPEPPDSTHSKNKKNGKRYTCSQGKRKRRVLEPQSAPSQCLADRNWITGAGGSLQEWVRGLPS